MLKISLKVACLGEKAASGMYARLAKTAEKKNLKSAVSLCEALSKSEKAHADMIKNCLDEISNQK